MKKYPEKTLPSLKQQNLFELHIKFSCHIKLKQKYIFILGTSFDSSSSNTTTFNMKIFSGRCDTNEQC